jgi:hypothetical protein
MDGGWRRWTAEGRHSDAVVPAVKPAAYPPPDSGSPTAKIAPALRAAEGNEWNWRRALDDNGFRPYQQLAALADSAGLRQGTSVRIRFPADQLAHLMLTLHLLGREVTYDEPTSILTVARHD